MRHEPSPSEQFASMLEALKTDHGMTPTAIAKEAGISRATVWRLTNGDSRQPSYEVGHRIERLYREKRR
ncbi:helix-turn-helix domain-containing protein [Sinorhizobium medicae]|uniref:helix-turn-helix domain-containing protein n=1 Tax=Sinorhizobium medicae TaxID=110321 RepID=UPI0004766D7B|nr:helix-turn-helix transcriptional regulator [Sinorhizobium medicae]MDX0831229.1 helix-turn-helix domain-containing protein [Sinorhizobium medicae]RVI57146.1 XRE family transcriptional regulator [Sinorhizobium medicae]UFX00303.1 helix-turn-helix domain-containing protein [Sinorhizobium medicae WSM1115]